MRNCIQPRGCVFESECFSSVGGDSGGTRADSELQGSGQGVQVDGSKCITVRGAFEYDDSVDRGRNGNASGELERFETFAGDGKRAR